MNPVCIKGISQAKLKFIREQFFTLQENTSPKEHLILVKFLVYMSSVSVKQSKAICNKEWVSQSLSITACSKQIGVWGPEWLLQQDLH